MKLTKIQIEEIKKLKEEKVKTIEIAKMYNVSQPAITYHLNAGYNKSNRINALISFNRKTPEQKKEKTKSRNDYMRNWMRRKRDRIKQNNIQGIENV